MYDPVEVTGADGKKYSFLYQDIGESDEINPLDSFSLADQIAGVFRAHKGSDFVVLAPDTTDLNILALQHAMRLADVKSVKVMGVWVTDDTQVEWFGAAVVTVTGMVLTAKVLEAMEEARMSRRALLTGTVLGLASLSGVGGALFRWIINHGNQEGKYATGHFGQALIDTMSDSSNPNVCVLVGGDLKDGELLPMSSMAKGVQNPSAFRGGINGGSNIGATKTYLPEK